MTAYDLNPACTQISSTIVINSSGDLVEIGWSEDGTVDQSCDLNSPLNVPYVFQAQQRDGIYSCTYEAINLVDGQQVGVGAIDQNLDENWAFTVNGTQQGRPKAESFSLGIVLTNAERHDDAAHAKADFNGLYFGSTGGWAKWTTAECVDPGPPHEDPGYNNQILSVQHITVTNNPADCTP